MWEKVIINRVLALSNRSLIFTNGRAENKMCTALVFFHCLCPWIRQNWSKYISYFTLLKSSGLRCAVGLANLFTKIHPINSETFGEWTVFSVDWRSQALNLEFILRFRLERSSMCMEERVLFHCLLENFRDIHFITDWRPVQIRLNQHLYVQLAMRILLNCLYFYSYAGYFIQKCRFYISIQYPFIINNTISNS